MSRRPNGTSRGRKYGRGRYIAWMEYETKDVVTRMWIPHAILAGVKNFEDAVYYDYVFGTDGYGIVGPSQSLVIDRGPQLVRSLTRHRKYRP